MDIQIHHFSEGAKKARGLAVVIDVFRAFSVACYVFDRGAREIVAVQEVDHARQLKQQNPSWVVIGERGRKKLHGFDYGNSPTELAATSFIGKTVIQTTHAGTQNLCATRDAEPVVTGSFLNAGATIDYIRDQNLPILSLICSGVADEKEATEDLLCAEYMRDVLIGTPRGFQDIKEELRGAQTSRRFFDPTREDAPESDFYLCLELDKFDFTVHRVSTDGRSCVLQRKAI